MPRYRLDIGYPKVVKSPIEFSFAARHHISTKSRRAPISGDARPDRDDPATLPEIERVLNLRRLCLMTNERCGYARGIAGSVAPVTRNFSSTNRIALCGRLHPHYSELHRIANFAGNLEQLKVAYADSTAEARADLSRQFDSIVGQLTMPNGVTKTTYPNRLGDSLSAVLSVVPLPHSEILRLRLASLSRKPKHTNL